MTHLTQITSVADQRPQIPRTATCRVRVGQFTYGEKYAKSGNINVLGYVVARIGIDSVWAGGIAAAGTPIQRQDWAHGDGFNT
jgi:hypothetical protein